MKKNNAKTIFVTKLISVFSPHVPKTADLSDLCRIYTQKSKIHLISAVIKAFAFFITLLEKSAVLLLLAGSFFLVLPFVMVIAFSIASVNFFLCLKVNRNRQTLDLSSG